MNTHTLRVANPQNFADVQKPAVLDASISASQRVAFFLVWAAVGVPMVWGVLKAWNEARLMF